MTGFNSTMRQKVVEESVEMDPRFAEWFINEDKIPQEELNNASKGRSPESEQKKKDEEAAAEAAEA